MAKAGGCFTCRRNAEAKIRYKNNPELIRSRERIRRMALKVEVMAAYGGCCKKCRIKDIDVLTIDHKENDGAVHRKVVMKPQLYLWLKKQGFPDTFQVLCANCNLKKEIMRLRETRQ